MSDLPTINYCVATYEGITPSRHGQLEELNLHNHFLQLAKLIPTLKIPITQITLIKPLCRTSKFSNYYRIEEWRKIIPVKIIVLEFDKPELYSYGQWIHAFETFPDFDYYILMEDDYIFAKDNFTTELLDTFKEKIPSGIGYLSTLVADMHGWERHAAISNGIISNSASKVFKLEEFISKTQRCSGDVCQLIFSKILMSNNIQLGDFSDKYQALFWNNELRNYSERNIENILIIPVQKLHGIYQTIFMK